MSETEHQSSESESTGPRPVRRITFDDFEIEGDALSEEQESRPGFLKNAIPRIRSMKDDLLGGSTKLSSKIFGGKTDTTPFEEPTLPIDPLSAPYFSDEERSLIRVKKIPKKVQIPE